MIINNIVTQKIIQKIKNSPNYYIGDFLNLDDIEVKQYAKYQELINNNYPLDYIIGCVDINSIRFYVEEGMFIPRPCTEELIQLYKDSGEDTIIDDCAGSGLIGISIAKAYPNKKIILIEQSKIACTNIAKTILYNNILNVELIEADALTVDYNVFGNYSLICNPPYVPLTDIFDSVKYEPKDAIYSGNDGLTFFNKLIIMFSTNLPKQIYLELDPSNIIEAQIRLNKLYNTSVTYDNEGFLRFLIGNLK